MFFFFYKSQNLPRKAINNQIPRHPNTFESAAKTPEDFK